jgi:hypothetical protein
MALCPISQREKALRFRQKCKRRRSGRPFVGHEIAAVRRVSRTSSAWNSATIAFISGAGFAPAKTSQQDGDVAISEHRRSALGLGRSEFRLGGGSVIDTGGEKRRGRGNDKHARKRALDLREHCSSPRLSAASLAAVLLRSLCVLLRFLQPCSSAVALSFCGGRQRERADAEDERCHDCELDLGHLSSPCFKPLAQGDRTIFARKSSGHQIVYRLRDIIAAQSRAHAITVYGSHAVASSLLGINPASIWSSSNARNKEVRTMRRHDPGRIRNDRPFALEVPIAISQNDAGPSGTEHNMLYVLGFGLVGAILANTIILVYFNFFLIAS